jgi:hypothetical protein
MKKVIHIQKEQSELKKQVKKQPDANNKRLNILNPSIFSIF